MTPSDGMGRGTARRTIRVSDELWDAAVERARADGTTVSDVVRAALEKYVRGEPPNPCAP